MSSISIELHLTYPDAEHARLVFEAFSQWPTMTVRKQAPNAKRMKAIKASMDWIDYDLPNIYQLVFEQQSCTLEEAPIREGNAIKLHFYCGKWAGNQLWEALFSELVAKPVSIEGFLYADFDGSNEHQIKVVS